MGRQIIFVTVARGPVPRDLSTAAENARNPETPVVCCSDRGTARDRPSPYVPCGDFFFLTVARELSPRRWAIYETPSSNLVSFPSDSDNRTLNQCHRCRQSIFSVEFFAECPRAFCHRGVSEDSFDSFC